MSAALNIPMHALRYVLLVADTRSYKVSAQRAHRTQPALSLAIKQLEEALGQQLFEPQDRTKLTPFGQACLQPIRDLLDHHANAIDTLSRISRHEHDIVTFACVPTVSTHLVPGVMPKFQQAFPQVGVSLLDDNSSNIESMVINGRVDFGLCSSSSTDPELHFEPLMQDRYGIICAKNHELATREELSWDELRDLPLIGSVSLELLKSVPELPGLPEPKLRIWNMMSLLAMIERGNGVTILGTLTIPPSYSSRISFVPIEVPLLPREVGFLRLAKRTLSLPCDAMISLIREHVRTTMPDYAAQAN